MRDSCSPEEKHLHARIDGLRELVMELRDADEKRDELLRDNIEHRLDSLNEFSKRMEKLETTFVSEELFGVWQETVHGLTNWRSNMEGRMYVLAGFPMMVSLIIGALTLGVAIWLGR